LSIHYIQSQKAKQFESHAFIHHVLGKGTPLRLQCC